MTDSPPTNKTLHVLAWLTALATFPLIFLGGLVTSKAAGMSVPDWPNSWGYNMFLLPFDHWAGNIFYEHLHRLIASLVGFLSLVLTLHAWGPAAGLRGRRVLAGVMGALFLTSLALGITTAQFRPVAAGSTPLDHATIACAGLTLVSFVAFLCRYPEPRRWVRWLCTAALGAVMFQGLLGGLRVVLVKIDLAMVHGCFAQAYLCIAALTVFVTGTWWQNAPDLSASEERPAGKRLITLASACLVVVYAQLVVGAIMRHEQAGLAIPDLLLAYGQTLPPTSDAQLDAANAYRLSLHDPALLPAQVTLGQVWLAFTHRVGAVVVSIVMLMVVGYVHTKLRKRKILVRMASVLGVLLLVQVTLGLCTVYFRKPADVASAHVATGALVLMTSFLLFSTALRLYARVWRTAPRFGTIPTIRHPTARTGARGSRFELNV